MIFVSSFEVLLNLTDAFSHSLTPTSVGNYNIMKPENIIWNYAMNEIPCSWAFIQFKVFKKRKKKNIKSVTGI